MHAYKFTCAFKKSLVLKCTYNVFKHSHTRKNEYHMESKLDKPVILVLMNTIRIKYIKWQSAALWFFPCIKYTMYTAHYIKF